MPRGVPKAGFRNTRRRREGMLIPDNMPGFVPAVPLVVETEEEIRAKLTKRFEAMDLMTHSTAIGENRSLIISGPAGLGKSYGVTKVVEHDIGEDVHYEFVRGFVRATGMYQLLYRNKSKKSVIVFDDADSIFFDDVSLNLLKAACDSLETRTISWMAETKMEDMDGERLPRSFEFEGSVIFITNLDFDRLIASGNKLAPHLEAMISRSHYLDLAMKSKKDYIVRIKMVVEQGMLRSHGLGKEMEKTLVHFVEENQDVLRELSLRMVLKIAGLAKMHPGKWRELAKLTCMKGKQ